MSLFFYHIVCPECNLTSLQYPYLFSDVFSNELELPVSNLLREEFEVAKFEVKKNEVTDRKLNEIVKNASNKKYKVSFPKLNLEAFSLDFDLYPELPCPRCNYKITKGIGNSSSVKIFDANNKMDLIKNAHIDFDTLFDYNKSMLIRVYPRKDKSKKIFKWTFRINFADGYEGVTDEELLKFVRKKEQDAKQFIDDLIKEIISMGHVVLDLYNEGKYFSFYEEVVMNID